MAGSMTAAPPPRPSPGPSTLEAKVTDYSWLDSKMAQSQEGPTTPGLHTHRWLLAPPRPHCPTGVGGRNEPADGHCPQAVEERVVLEQV